MTLVQYTVKSSFQSYFYLLIRCDINEQIPPFVLTILRLGLEMFCQRSKCNQNHDLGFVFILKNWGLCICLDLTTVTLFTIRNILNSAVTAQKFRSLFYLLYVL